MKPLVSIITPCYNAELTITETIESVLAQSYTNWEMLIVDDCSTDNSKEIILSYTKNEPRIKYYRTQATSGSPALPRNLCIEKAQGDFVAFLDSDDMWLSNKLELQIELFERDPNVAIVYSNYEKMDEGGELRNRIVKAPSETSYQDLLYGNVIACLTAVYSVSKVGKIYMKNIHHEDYVLWLSILKRGYVAKNTNTVLALYRLRKSSISANKWKVLFWQWNIYVNVEKIGCIKALFYFFNYAIKAMLKSFK